MECAKCQSKNLDVVNSGPHHKLVCTDCFSFVKFLKKGEAKNFIALKQKGETSCNKTTG